MFKVEIDQTLRRLMQIFHLFGIWRTDEESDFWKSCRRFLYMLQNTLYTFFILMCAYLSDDKNQQIFLADMALVGQVLGFKLWCLLYRKDELLQFLDGTIVKRCIPDDEETVAINKKIKNIVLFIKFYSWFSVVTNALLIVVSYPMFTSEKKLPMFIRFSSFGVDSDHETALHWLTLIYATTGNALFVVYNFTIMFIWYIMRHLSIEYEILGNRLRKLGYSTTRDRPNSFHRELFDLIQAHKNISDSVERFRSCFAKLFLVEIFTGALGICGSTYNLAYGSLTDVVGMIYFAALLFYAIFDIFLIMYLANEITLESSRLSYCLFESNWIEQSESTKKCMIILCEIFKQPQQMIIFVYPMNLDKFVSIINGAYSMFNILKSFNK